MKFFVSAMLFVTLIFVIYFMNPRVWAEDAKPTKELMGKFLSQMETLKPYMVSEEKFTDSKNFIEIDSHLKELALLSKKAVHDPKLRLAGYRVPRKIFENHIIEMERVFRVGNKQYARWMLNSTLSICMSCHTQIPTVSRGLKDFEKLDTLTSSFDQAEFLFATRAFDQAKDSYEKMILNYPAGNIKTEQVETALERVIAYYARLQRDPGGAVQALEQYQKNSKLPTFLKDDITAWLQVFKDWKKEPVLDANLLTGPQVVLFAKKNLDPKVSGFVMTADNPRAVLYLKVSGILYQYLQQHPDSEQTPEILYWLAICDKGLNNNFFYSLGNIYLRECIINYPRSPIAPKCYEEYELETIVSYSGSSGTHMPAEVRNDLDRLKGLIKFPPAAGVKH